MAAMTDQEFSTFSTFIYDTCGIRMPPAKKTMLESRLQKRLRQHGMQTFRQYWDFLRQGDAAEELVSFIDVVTTNKTDFFRESNHFDYLVREAIPTLLERTPGPLKVWSAGCSSGEEPYTLTMVLADHAEAHGGPDFSILATDICTQVLEKAHTGIYPEDRVEPVPLPMKKKYLLRSRDRSRRVVRVVPELRRKITFRRVNFMDHDFGITDRFHVIFCRNVIIYFDKETQEKVLRRLVSHLVPGGYLFMGHSETLNGMDVPVSQVMATVYRKI